MIITSDGGSIKIWEIPDDFTLKETIRTPKHEISNHSIVNRINFLQFHPTSSNLVVSTNRNNVIHLFDLENDKEFISIKDSHNDLIQSVSWNYYGNLFSTSSKDKNLRVIDPRQSKVVQSVEAHKSAKGFNSLWLGNRDRLLTCGFSKTGEREISVWDSRNLSKSLHSILSDTNPGALIPYYDTCTNVVFLFGKGDRIVKYYEVTEDENNLLFLSQFQCKDTLSDVCAFPKRVVDVSICEISRFARLTKDKIEHVMFQVPKKEKGLNIYYEDLYTDVQSKNASTSAKEWFSGIDKERVLIPSSDLKPEGYTSVYEIAPEPKENSVDDILQAEISVDSNSNLLLAERILNREPSLRTLHYEEDKEEEEYEELSEELDDFVGEKNEVIDYNDEYKYKGEVQDGQRHGDGTFYNENTKIAFIGEWENDIREGRGKIMLPGGESMVGLWKDNKVIEKKYVFKDGSVYVGEDPKKFGIYEGKFTYSSGEVFEGKFREGKRHSKGKMIYENNIIYEGEWKNDLRHGEGVMIFKDGSKFEGEWRYDLMDGNGKFTTPKGNVIQGKWKRGNLIEIT